MKKFVDDGLIGDPNGVDVNSDGYRQMQEMIKKRAKENPMSDLEKENYSRLMEHIDNLEKVDVLTAKKPFTKEDYDALTILNEKIYNFRHSNK